jgi:acetolactate synthase-1/2/3 large subunit
MFACVYWGLIKKYNKGLAVMNGADLLIKKLADAGVSACFANPGTSEMQLVAALDKEPRIRAVLGLFEGVVTGAADGFARMTDAPALTLLHLGPGYANGIANLHNASRARVPVLNMIGDHATHHLELDAPLTSDIDGLGCQPVPTTCPKWDSKHGKPAWNIRAM